MSVIMFRPVTSASATTTLEPRYSNGRTNECQSPLKTSRFRERVEGKEDYFIQFLFRYHRDHALLDEDSTVQVDPLFRMNADDVNDVFLYTAIEEHTGNVKRLSQVSCFPGMQSGSQQCQLLVL